MPQPLPLARVLSRLIAVVLLVFGAYTIGLLAATWPLNPLTIDKAGTFGDSFGALTSLFTGLAFAGLLSTIYLQRSELHLNRQELEETRKEFRLQSETFHRQRFEDAFYRMLSLYKENLRELSIRPHNHDANRIHGIDALNHLNTKFSKAWAAHHLNIFPTEGEDQIEYIFLLSSTIQSVYARQTRYVETLANILILVQDECPTPEAKAFFWRIIASQLTAYELKYLFYQAFVSPDFEPLRSMIIQSTVLQERIATLGLPESHRRAFEVVWKIPLYPKRNPFRSPLTATEIKQARKRIQRRERHRVQEAARVLDAAKVTDSEE